MLMLRHLHAQDCPAWAHRPPKKKIYKSQFLYFMFQIIYFLSDKLKYINSNHLSPCRFGLGVTVLMLRHLHAQYCPGLGLQAKLPKLRVVKGSCSLYFMLQVKALVPTNFRGRRFPL